MTKTVDQMLDERVTDIDSLAGAYEKLDDPKFVPNRKQFEQICAAFRTVLDKQSVLIEGFSELQAQNDRMAAQLLRKVEQVRTLHGALHDPNRDSPYT